MPNMEWLPDGRLLRRDAGIPAEWLIAMARCAGQLREAVRAIEYEKALSGEGPMGFR